MVDDIDDDEHKYKGYGHILAIGRDNLSPFFSSTCTYPVSFLYFLLYNSTKIDRGILSDSSGILFVLAVSFNELKDTKRRYKRNIERYESNANIGNGTKRNEYQIGAIGTFSERNETNIRSERTERSQNETNIKTKRISDRNKYQIETNIASERISDRNEYWIGTNRTFTRNEYSFRKSSRSK